MFFIYKVNKKFLCISFIFILSQAPLELATVFSTIALNVQGSAFAFAFSLGQYLFFIGMFIHLYEKLNDFNQKPVVKAPVFVAQATQTNVPPTEPKEDKAIVAAEDTTDTLKKKLASLDSALSQALISEEEYQIARSQIIENFIS